ncbi:MAG: uL15 family ribosomal protein [Thaumarchaeota archaeon]|nr:uL15 family ribosomal protein [Nitrososphaerota archaeon]
MPTRFRKVRKKRGSRTHGWGQVGQHRKSGSRGGRGKAGMAKHKWTYTIKYEPDHFGKDKLPKKSFIKKWVNVGQLDSIAERLGKEVLDLNSLGYEKLLGAGEVKKPYTVIVRSFTELAKKKVEDAGGRVVSEAWEVSETS